MEDNTNTILQDSPLLKEIRIWKNIFRKNYLFIIILSIVGTFLGYYYASNSRPTYTASLKFVMKQDAANGINSNLANLSTLLGSGSTATGSPLERVIEVIGSGRIIGNTLLEEVTINNKKDLLVNFFIEAEALKKTWASDSILSKVTYSKYDEYENLSFSQRKGISLIIRRIIGSKDGILTSKGIVSKSFDKKSGVVTISSRYFNEHFAIALCNTLFKQIIDFYTEQASYSSVNSVKVLQKKADSLQNVLRRVQSQYATNNDQSLGVLLQRDKVDNRELAIKEQMLVTMYAEVQKNLQTLKFMQESSVPAFAVIDSPFSPIEPKMKNSIIYALIGFFIPLLLCLGILRLRYFF